MSTARASRERSSTRGVSKLGPKQGVIVATEGNGWSHNAYTATPGIPGDSGSGFMNGSGQAVGVLSTVELLPRAGSNNFGDIAKEIDYMRANSSFSNVGLVPGTEPFTPDWVGAILSSQRRRGRIGLGPA